MPVNYRTFSGTLAQFTDASTLVILSVYFRFVSKDWLPFQIFGVGITFMSVAAMACVPESPKYLYSKGMYAEARKALQFIEKFNRLCKRGKH